MFFPNFPIFQSFIFQCFCVSVFQYYGCYRFSVVPILLQTIILPRIAMKFFLRMFSIFSFICIYSMFSTSSVSHYSFLMPTIWFLNKTRYDKKDTTRLTLFGLQLISAMSPPGGGRNPVTSRFLRHFNIITITKFSDDTLVKIFGSIMNHNFRVGLFFSQFWFWNYQWIVELSVRTSTVRRLMIPLVPSDN